MHLIRDLGLVSTSEIIHTSDCFLAKFNICSFATEVVETKADNTQIEFPLSGG